MEFGESPEVAVRREVLEETGLEVTPDALLRAWVFEPETGTQVLIVSYGCKRPLASCAGPRSTPLSTSTSLLSSTS